jgi:hypothetical protein
MIGFLITDDIQTVKQNAIPVDLNFFIENCFIIEEYENLFFFYLKELFHSYITNRESVITLNTIQ